MKVSRGLNSVIPKEPLKKYLPVPLLSGYLGRDLSARRHGNSSSSLEAENTTWLLPSPYATGSAVGKRKKGSLCVIKPG